MTHGRCLPVRSSVTLFGTAKWPARDRCFATCSRRLHASAERPEAGDTRKVTSEQTKRDSRHQMTIGTCSRCEGKTCQIGAVSELEVCGSLCCSCLIRSDFLVYFLSTFSFVHLKDCNKLLLQAGVTFLHI